MTKNSELQWEIQHRLVKMGRLIMQNTRHMNYPSNCRAAPLGTDKKGMGRLEDIFMETVLIEHYRKLKLYTVDAHTHMVHNDRQEESNCSTSNGAGGRKVIILLPSNRTKKLIPCILSLMAD